MQDVRDTETTIEKESPSRAAEAQEVIKYPARSFLHRAPKRWNEQDEAFLASFGVFRHILRLDAVLRYAMNEPPEPPPLELGRRLREARHRFAEAVRGHARSLWRRFARRA